MAAGPRPERFAPGLLRVPVASVSAVQRGSRFTPLSLTRDVPPEQLPIGVIAPTGDVPWGCLFFTLVAASLIIGIFSRHWAVIAAGIGLILFWGSYNHPRRVAAGQARRGFSLLGSRNVRRAAQALETALSKQSENEGLHYLAAIAAHTLEQFRKSIEHLDQARPRMAAYAEFHHIRGRNLIRLGDLDEGILSLERALEFLAYPGRKVLLQELQEHYLDRGDEAGEARMARELGLEEESPGSPEDPDPAP
jgi:hypothetical protein